MWIIFGCAAENIRFDWAAKHILRDKADFVVFEGLISALVGEQMTIIEMLENGTVSGPRRDRFSRLEFKAVNSKGELILLRGPHPPLDAERPCPGRDVSNMCNIMTSVVLYKSYCFIDGAEVGWRKVRGKYENDTTFLGRRPEAKFIH